MTHTRHFQQKLYAAVPAQGNSTREGPSGEMDRSRGSATSRLSSVLVCAGVMDVMYIRHMICMYRISS